jgi:hypothetical protein
MTSENTPPEVLTGRQIRFREHEECFRAEKGEGSHRSSSGLPADLAAVLGEYVEALAAAPLAPQSRRTYASKVRQYLGWVGATRGSALGQQKLEAYRYT